MAKIVIKWKSSFLGAACKFDVYLMNTYIGELKCGGTLETTVDVGNHMLFFKEKRTFGKRSDTSFEVVVNEEMEIVELKTKFDMNGNFVVRYADNAPHIPTHNNNTTSQLDMDCQKNTSNDKSNYFEKRSKKTGCLGGCLSAILIMIAIILVVSIILGDNDSSNDVTISQTQQAVENSDVQGIETNNQQDRQKENILYLDDNFKITFVDFKDPKMGVTSYNLLLKIENNSDKTVIVSPSDGYANDEAVFLGSGMPVKVKPNKKITGAFVVGYGNTSIQSIDEIKTIELKLTLYDENFSEKILTTGDILINLE